MAESPAIRRRLWPFSREGASVRTPPDRPFLIALRYSLPLLVVGAAALTMGVVLAVEGPVLHSTSRPPLWLLAVAIGVVALTGGSVALLFGDFADPDTKSGSEKESTAENAFAPGESRPAAPSLAASVSAPLTQGRIIPLRRPGSIPTFARRVPGGRPGYTVRAVRASSAVLEMTSAQALEEVERIIGELRPSNARGTSATPRPWSSLGGAVATAQGPRGGGVPPSASTAGESDGRDRWVPSRAVSSPSGAQQPMANVLGSTSRPSPPTQPCVNCGTATPTAPGPHRCKHCQGVLCAACFGRGTEDRNVGVCDLCRLLPWQDSPAGPDPTTE